MLITNKESGTNIHEIADGIYRISTPVVLEGGPGGFSFNQFLIVDDEPLLFHTGPHKMFTLVQEAVVSVLPVERLRYIGFSHVEADECGSMSEWLTAAPLAVPLCSKIAAMTSMSDLTDRPVRGLADAEVLSLGKHRLRWFDTPHVPHGWDCGLIMDEGTRTLLCSDLFTQGGSNLPAVTEEDILGPSEMMRKAMDYYSHSPDTRAILEKLASAEPTTLACMHASTWKGDGSKLLRALADAVAP